MAESSGHTEHSSLKRWILPLLALAIAAALILPPLVNISRYHRRIADGVSRSIGRPVRMSSVKLRLLPHPGFDIYDFSVEEDPGFGAEPVLRSPEVTAYIRLSSLWRGRLEISRISLDEPSLNLVRNDQGRWNFASILNQAAQSGNAPTSQARPGPAARFPYIEASHARVNFKHGLEKLPFSFLDADLAVWLETPGEWQLRFEAQPARTDLALDLAETGTVRLEGSLRSAAVISDTGLNLKAQWLNAAFGQLSRMLAGSDADWRGQLNLLADIAGTANQPSIRLRAEARGIHRFEFEPSQTLNVSGTCETTFSQFNHVLGPLTCLVPTGSGHLLLTGKIGGIGSAIRPDLSLEVNHLPAAYALSALRLVRSGFARNLQVAGVVNGEVRLPPEGAPEASAAIEELTITSPSADRPMVVHGLRFTTPVPSTHHRRRSPPPKTLQILLQPLSLAPSLPLTVAGSFDGNGFNLHLTGHSPAQASLVFFRHLGVSHGIPSVTDPHALADFDLTLHGPWMLPVSDSEHPPSPTALDGTVRLRNAQFQPGFLSHPIEILNAQASFSSSQVMWNPVTFSYGPIHGTASFSVPLTCDLPAGCPARFTLHAAELDAAVLQSAIEAPQPQGTIQQLLSRIERRANPWPQLAGTVLIDSLTLGPLTLAHASATLQIDKETARLESLNARALGGSVHFSGDMRFTDNVPHYSLDLQLSRVSIPAAASLFNEDWGPGAVNAGGHLELAGYHSTELAASATGDFHWIWGGGGLPTGESSALPQIARFDRWESAGVVASSALVLRNSKITAGEDVVPLSGRISFSRELNLTAATPGRSVSLSGTLPHPLIESTSTTAEKTPQP